MRTRGIFLCICMALLSLYDVYAQVSVREDGVSRAYQVLRWDIPFEEQVTTPNTIFEICNVFDLSGKTIDIPPGCVLNFVGGKLYGGAVHFNDTILKYSGNFSDVCDVVFSGRFTSDVLDKTVTFRIPTDFPNLQSAVDYVSAIPVKQGEEIVLLIEKGHSLTSGLKIVNGDYSRIRISAEDAIVPLSPDFDGVMATDSMHPNLDGIEGSLFVAINCRFPTINALFDMRNLFGDGVAAYNSNVYVNQGCGVINAGRFGIYAKDASTVMAGHSNWSGSNYCGIRLQHATNGYFVRAMLKGCHKKDYGDSNLGAVYVSKQCLAQVRESTIEDTPYGNAVLVRRSRVDLELSLIRNCPNGIRAEGGSFVSANGCMIDGVKVGASVYAIGGSIIAGLVDSRNNAHRRADYAVAAGGMILGARSSSSAAETESKVYLSDCSGITAFNVFSEGGIICPKNSVAAYQKVKNGKNGYIIRYPSHAELFCKILLPITVAAEASAWYSGLDIVPSGYSVEGVSISAVGKENVNGTGESTIMSVSVDPSYKQVGLYNTGVHPGSSSKASVKSVYLDVHMNLSYNE